MGRIRSTLVILIGMLICVPVLRADAQALMHASESICNFPVNPLPPTHLSASDRVEWCYPALADVATSFAIDVGDLRTPLETTCRPVVGGSHCAAAIPQTLIGASAFAIVATEAGVDGEPAAFQLTDPETTVTCGYTSPGSSVKETRPKDSSIGGLLSNNLQDASVRLGQLRRDGWRVEWQYTTATSMLGTVTERIVIMAWCIGVPQ